MKRLIIGGLAALAIVLTGCSGNAAPASAPSTTTPPPPVEPTSALAPITLPAGAVDDAIGPQPHQSEYWKTHGSFDAVVSHLAGQLPTDGQDFNGLKWCTKTVVTAAEKPGFFGYPPDETVDWSWGDHDHPLSIRVFHTSSTQDDEDIQVLIDRDPNLMSDRSSCDAEKAAAPPVTPEYSNADCDGDIVPEKDGVCRVSGGGFFDTGLMAGWIETSARPGERCMWARLDGPKMTLEMVIDSGGANEGEGPIDVHVQEGDYAFYSKGCEPWKRIH